MGDAGRGLGAAAPGRVVVFAEGAGVRTGADFALGAGLVAGLALAVGAGLALAVVEGLVPDAGLPVGGFLGVGVGLVS